MIGSPPGETLYGVDFDLGPGPNEVDDTDFAETRASELMEIVDGRSRSTASKCGRRTLGTYWQRWMEVQWREVQWNDASFYLLCLDRIG